MNLFYNLNHYSKYYEENEYVEYKDVLKVPLLKLDDTIFYEDNYSCKDCNAIDTILVIFERQKIKVCLKCLKIMVDNVLFERALNLDLESYISRECKKNIILSNYFKLFSLY